MSGQLGTTTSSLRFKEKVADMGAASDDLMRLRPVTFQSKRTGRPPQARRVREQRYRARQPRRRRRERISMKGEEVSSDLDISMMLKGVNDQPEILLEQLQEVGVLDVPCRNEKELVRFSLDQVAADEISVFRMSSSGVRFPRGRSLVWIASWPASRSRYMSRRGRCASTKKFIPRRLGVA